MAGDTHELQVRELSEPGKRSRKLDRRYVSKLRDMSDDNPICDMKFTNYHRTSDGNGYAKWVTHEAFTKLYSWIKKADAIKATVPSSEGSSDSSHDDFDAPDPVKEWEYDEIKGLVEWMEDRLVEYDYEVQFVFKTNHDP